MSDLEFAAELVAEAARLAARMRDDGVWVRTKTGVSDVVTAADHAAEELIVRRLAAERPDDGLLGEEGARRPGRRTWVIDPVDGTWNFASGLAWWCSAIALTDGDDLLLGAIHHVASDTTFAGGPGLGATAGGRSLEPLPDRPLGEGCVTTYLHPGSYGGAVGAAFQRVVDRAATVRMMGSGSMDLTALAQGHTVLFCQHSVPAWDRLPGEAIIRGLGGTSEQIEAGGVVWTLIGGQSAVAEAAWALRS